MKKKHVLIIGSDGFIGTYLYEKLKSKNYFNVEKISRENYGDIYKNLNWFKKIKRDTVIYLLAFENDLNLFETDFSNLTKKYEFFCKCMFIYIKKRKFNPNIIFSSTVSIYGLTDRKKTNENSIENIISWYDFTKHLIERYFIFFSNIYDLNFISLRISNVYGFSKSNQKGRGFINKILKRSIDQGENIVKVYDNGKYFRDYIYIDDVISALIGFAKKKNIKEKIFNLCSGKSISIFEVLKIMKLKLSKRNIVLKILKIKSPKNTHPINKRDFYGNNLRIKKIIGWKPKYNIDRGIELTIRRYINK